MKNRANPSKPNIILMFIVFNQPILVINWKLVLAGSKKKSKQKLRFKIISDQINEKLRINEILLLSKKHNTIEPNNGKIHNNNNIKILNKRTLFFFISLRYTKAP